MRLILQLTFLLSILSSPFLSAQSTDSLTRAIDANAQAIEQSAKEIQRWKDSLEREKIFRNLEEHGQSLDDFLQEMRAKEEKRKRQVYYRIGFGALFLIVLVVSLARRYKRKG